MQRAARPDAVPMIRSQAMAMALALAPGALFGACTSSASRSDSGAPSPLSQPQAGTRAGVPVVGPTLVRLQIDGGEPSAPVVHPAAGKVSLHLQFPVAFAGQRIDLAIERGLGNARVPWMQLQPQIDGDGTLRMAGLPVGHYDLCARCPGAAMPVEARGVIDVTVPGERVVPMFLLPLASPSAAPLR
jgi:hypothetical protein